MLLLIIDSLGNTKLEFKSPKIAKILLQPSVGSWSKMDINGRTVDVFTVEKSHHFLADNSYIKVFILKGDMLYFVLEDMTPVNADYYTRNQTYQFIPGVL